MFRHASIGTSSLNTVSSSFRLLLPIRDIALQMPFLREG
jgi:hypothetical protein